MVHRKSDSFHVIADPTRRQILRILYVRSQTIKMIAEHFAISRPAISKHIKLLSQAGFLLIKQTGRERHCVLGEAGFIEIRKWLGYFEK